MDQDIKEANYENVIVDCPKCGFENVYNRVTDLKTIKPIARMDGLCCESCGLVFSIVGDHTRFAKFCWFIDDLSLFRKQKQYGRYILNLCQGVECFFGEGIINKKYDRNPIFRDRNGNLLFIEYHREKKLFIKNCFQKMSFHELRKLFLEIYEEEFKKPTSRIKLMKKDKLTESVEIVRKTNINVVRNKVIHKEAYRPSLAEISTFDDLIKAIYWMRTYLNVCESNYLANTNTAFHN